MGFVLYKILQIRYSLKLIVFLGCTWSLSFYLAEWGFSLLSTVRMWNLAIRQKINKNPNWEEWFLFLSWSSCGQCVFLKRPMALAGLKFGFECLIYYKAIFWKVKWKKHQAGNPKFRNSYFFCFYFMFSMPEKILFVGELLCFSILLYHYRKSTINF